MNKKLKYGYLFAFEGCEGSGKSTVIKHVEQILKNKGYEVITSREPGGCSISEQIRNILSDERNDGMDNLTELLLFLASRNEHFKKIIKPALKDNKIVLCDRYIDSSIVYQNIIHNHNKKIEQMFNLSTEIITNETNKWYSESYYLQLQDVETGLKRISDNNREQDRFDKKTIDFHKEIKKRYDELYLNQDKNRKIINADRDSKEIANEIAERIIEIIGYDEVDIREDIKNNYQHYNFVYFWKHLDTFNNHYLSQWYNAPFVDNGICYKNMEQYMMSQKAKLFADKETEIKILKENDPKRIKQLGRLVKNFNQDIWNEHKYNIVFRGNMLKFTQYKNLGELLKQFPENTVFVEASPYDKIWGIGLSEKEAMLLTPKEWNGENLLGFALTEVKKYLDNKHRGFLIK